MSGPDARLRPPRRALFVGFKLLIYGLLLLNVWAFVAATDQHYKAVDQAAWVIILGVFEHESRRAAAGLDVAASLTRAVWFELAGYGGALYALWHYVAAANWLDTANAVAWLAISVLIWLDLLRPAPAGSATARWRSGARAALYALTFVCAVAWGVAGALLDFYDAVLWILCFFIIELNLLGLDEARPPRRG